MFSHVIVLNGEAAQAFDPKHPELYASRLLQVMGAYKTVRAFQVRLTVSSLNEGHTFVLDAGLRLWVWHGKETGPFERRKAIEIAHDIRLFRHGSPKLDVVESGQEDDAFWVEMGGSASQVTAAQQHRRESMPAIPEHGKAMWRLSDTNGHMMLTEEEFGMQVLDTQDVFFVDVWHTVYVWVGARSTRQEKNKAAEYAAMLLRKQQRSDSTPIVRVSEGAETQAFLDVF